tara:strand:- start:996 stop:1550 length:555 start_codon:yes stop_codon:yes gene_type:complete
MRLIPYILTAPLFLYSSVLLAEEIGKIKDTDTIKRRVEARSYSLYSFGGGSAKNMGGESSSKYLSYSHIWETTPFAAVKFNGEGSLQAGDTSSTFLAANLGINLFASASTYAPYIGLDFGYGAAPTQADGVDSVTGWAGGFSLGLAIFRTSSVQMHITARHARLFTSNQIGSPSISILTLGVAI